jgi:hypothetical protein
VGEEREAQDGQGQRQLGQKVGQVSVHSHHQTLLHLKVIIQSINQLAVNQSINWQSESINWQSESINHLAVNYSINQLPVKYSKSINQLMNQPLIQISKPKKRQNRSASHTSKPNFLRTPTPSTPN